MVEIGDLFIVNQPKSRSFGHIAVITEAHYNDYYLAEWVDEPDSLSFYSGFSEAKRFWKKVGGPW